MARLRPSSSFMDSAPRLRTGRRNSAPFGERYRLLLVDLPGHWRSALPRERLTIEAMAERVDALLDQLDTPPAHVVGLSLGGSVGLELALRAPARVRSLTLVNAFARLGPPDAAGGLRMLARLVLLGVAPMSVVAAFVARGLFPEPQQAHLYRLAVASLGRTSRWTYLASIGALVAFDARARLGRVACPTLVVAGERDRTVSLASTAALGRDIPGARVELVPDSGHVTNRDQPTIFNRIVLDFLAAH